MKDYIEKHVQKTKTMYRIKAYYKGKTYYLGCKRNLFRTYKRCSKNRERQI